MSWTMWRISTSCDARELALLLLRRDNSSAPAALARRFPSACMSQRRAFVNVTADSKVVLPRADLDLVRSGRSKVLCQKGI